MSVFRVERNRNYTVMSNYHLRDRRLSLKAKGLLSQMLSLDGVLGQGDEVVCQTVSVAGLEEKTIDTVVDEVWDAPNPGADGGKAGPGPLGEGVGKGLREGGEGVDVNGLVEGIGVTDPAGKTHGI